MKTYLPALTGLLLLTAAAQAAPAKTYIDIKHSFTVEYPAAWRLDRTARPDSGAGQLIVGFAVPNSLTKGTNLSRDSRVSIETLSKGTCSAARFLEDGTDTKVIRENGVRYSVGNFGDAGAGNRYEQTVYARDTGRDCIAVRLFIHSTNIGNYDPGTVREFDRKALDAAFDNIRHSLKVGR